MLKNTLLKVCLFISIIFPAISNANAEQLISFSAGDIPIIITAPHGGNEAIPNTPKRTGLDKNGKKKRGFQPNKDSWTRNIALTIAEKYQQHYGVKPYVVVANFHRKYLDANRSTKSAYEHENAKKQYDAYHGQIKAYINEVNEKFGTGLLLDVHGQAKSKGSIYRGTRNGTTVENLIKRYGWQAIVGENSLYGGLAEQGYDLLPKNNEIPNAENKKVERRYVGGNTVKRYGSQHQGGIDAIQMEIGSHMRFDSIKREKLSISVAKSLHDFVNHYLCNDIKKTNPKNATFCKSNK